jgi:hypothetical protein
MDMIVLETCQIDACDREAKYQMNEPILGGWVSLCASHDRMLGRRHLKDLGWTGKDVTCYEQDPDYVPAGGKLEGDSEMRGL